MLITLKLPVGSCLMHPSLIRSLALILIYQLEANSVEQRYLSTRSHHASTLLQTCMTSNVSGAFGRKAQEDQLRGN